ncbi:MAG: type II secretion system F family protein [Oscillospiraceae bacterium]|nr:type II secretion system F family protein [Oscillospiraceae bacterium]
MDNERIQTSEIVRLDYTKCNMTKQEHILAHIVFGIVVAVVVFIYYRSVILSAVFGVAIAPYLEKEYQKTVIKKRQSRLRTQFKEFLNIIAISVSGGSGTSLENAVIASHDELKKLYSDKSDIVHEIGLIIYDYNRTGLLMSEGFKDLGERSGIDDIKSFATVYSTLNGQSSDFGYIIKNTHDIIKEKIEITQEIETNISGAKSEAYIMLVMPLIVLLMMSSMGSGFLDALFTTFMGRVVATAGLAALGVSYIIATRSSDVEV